MRLSKRKPDELLSSLSGRDVSIEQGLSSIPTFNLPREKSVSLVGPVWSVCRDDHSIYLIC